MKTLEFKLNPTQAQAQTIELWCDQLRWVWNEGLSLLEEDQQRQWRKKAAIEDDFEQVSWYWHRNQDGTFGLACECTVYRDRELRPACPLRQHLEIENPARYVSKIQTNAANPDKLWLHAICSRFRNGVIDSLKKAWKVYLDPKHPARRPKYKGKRDKLRSLSNLNAGGKDPTVSFERIGDSANAYVRFPILGRIRVKGLFDRLEEGIAHGACRIVCEPSGYYLQVCVPSDPAKLKPSDRAVGIDPGVKALITQDNGKQVKPAQLLKKQSKRLRRLQRKASRQQKGSNSQKRTYQQLAQTHEKIRRSRNAFNHKVSTDLVREYGAIAFEDTRLQNMVRAPKAKMNEDGSFAQNGASRKAGLNRSLLDAAIGDLRAKIETKAKAADREFVRTAAPYSSLTCNCCGAIDKASRKSQSEFKCVACGHAENADVNAAQNHLQKGMTDFARSYRRWGWEVKRVDRSIVGGMKPEAEQSAPSRELSTPISKKKAKQSHEPEAVNPERADSTVFQAKRKRRSARSSAESITQLGLWDAGGAIA
jgi:putative transposase